MSKSKALCLDGFRCTLAVPGRLACQRKGVFFACENSSSAQQTYVGSLATTNERILAVFAFSFSFPVHCTGVSTKTPEVRAEQHADGNDDAL